MPIARPLFLIAWPALAVLALCVGCQEEPSSGGKPEGILATVGGQHITVDDLRAEATRRKESGRPVPAKEELLEELVTAEALVQAARAEGVGDDPEVRRSIRSLLIGHLKERELTPQLEALEVDDNAILRAYEKDREGKFTRPGRIQLAMIHLKGNPGEEALRTRAEEAAKLARSSPDGFIQAAVKYSDHQASRYRGGVIGFLLPDQPPAGVPHEIAAAGNALEAEGEIAGPLEHETGYYLVKLMRRVPASVVPITQVRDQLRRQLLSEQRQQVTRDFEESLRTRHGATIDHEALKAVPWTGEAEREESPPTEPR